jgi:hypothetical protein
VAVFPVGIGLREENEAINAELLVVFGDISCADAGDKPAASYHIARVPGRPQPEYHKDQQVVHGGQKT